MKTEQYCQQATHKEILELFNTLSKQLVKQYKIKENSSLKELTTKVANKKQFDTLYAKSYNDNRIYLQLVDDIKIIVKYL